MPVFVGSLAGLAEASARVDNLQAFTHLLGQEADEEDGPASCLPDAIRGYFENGGGPCYVASSTADGLDEALSSVDDVVTILVAPDMWNSGEEDAAAWARALTAHAAAYLQMAILHTDRHQTPDDAIETVKEWGLGEEAAFAAVYYPWLKTSSGDRAVPPSGPIAGIWAGTDRQRGVWKAPANTAVIGVSGLEHDVTDDALGRLNAAGINPIRHFPGRGHVVWGARTLAGRDDNPDLRWRYLPVRRLTSAVERDIQAALKYLTFEPNTQPTWEKARVAADSYLHSLWRMGGLQGTKPEEAYFVQVGNDITMDDDDVAQGRLILKVGLAPVRPAEFIILEITQDVAAAG
ncbi:phage tail sheath family protein [Streptomyces roseoverticillatus]|uniref:Phage tail sheath subtilisin-like domain-containing protein n=1 Tax=Streptomyces roseoverticillatus TaxID=66429 RepID=A0ABV3IX82_9ACTN